MNIKAIIAALVLLVVLAVGGYLLFSGEDAPDNDEVPAPQFTPPPLSDDPPVGGDEIEAIMRQMQEKRENETR